MCACVCGCGVMDELCIAYESDWSVLCVCVWEGRFSKPRCHCFMRHHKYFICCEQSICYCICLHWNYTPTHTWAIDFHSGYYFIVVCLFAMSASNYSSLLPATITTPSLPPFISIVLWILAQHLIFNLIRFERLPCVVCLSISLSLSLSPSPHSIILIFVLEL